MKEDILRELRAERARLFAVTVAVTTALAVLFVLFLFYSRVPLYYAPEDREVLTAMRLLIIAMASLVPMVFFLQFSWIRHWERRIGNP